MKFDDAKNMKAKEVLKLLQDLVKGNGDILRSNNREIKEIIKNNPGSKESLEIMKIYTEKNKKISGENQQLLELHTKLLCFLKSLHFEHNTNRKKTIPRQDEQKDFKEDSTNFELVFGKTIEGEIPFNHQHPFFDNREFKSKLIQYYISIEEYEICEELSKI